MATPSRQYHNLALTGFMGAGKTTVGYFLAELLRFELVDTDKVIEEQQGRRVSEIFAEQGEPAFRAMESKLVVDLGHRRDLIIATGGGLVLDPTNRAQLRETSLIACLWASPETIFERVRHQTHRPLLRGPDPLGKIRQLLEARAPSYREADLLVGVDFRNPPDTARYIAEAFLNARRAHPPDEPA